ncbi:hypothetical protein HIM_08768 [Hirsutella minnesotensis 3608]|nr:hypothetical protein HIM_08768 [Hirsutella minnesotensis 3608]
MQRGVHIAEGADQAAAIASQMFGIRFRDKTSKRETEVKNLYVQEYDPSGGSWYLAMTIDRDNYHPAVTISKTGGMNIAEIASHRPESLLTFGFSLSRGVTADLVSRISEQLGLSVPQSWNLERILRNLFIIFSQREATLLEVNILPRCGDQGFTVLDSRFVFDKSAEKRQQETFALRDTTQEVASEVEAERHGLVYVKLEGNIGNVVNGAGLAMATNDAIGFYGGASANFLDAGGKATKETMQQAFGIIIRDQRVKVILVNIYGGLTRCDMIAESIISAVDELDIRVPIVVRLQGTNSEKGLKLLEQANLGLQIESDFGRAAQRAVRLAKR